MRIGWRCNDPMTLEQGGNLVPGSSGYMAHKMNETISRCNANYLHDSDAD